MPDDSINNHAGDLFNYASENDKLDEFLSSALSLTQKNNLSGPSDMPGDLSSFLKLVSESDLMDVLLRFIYISREHLGLLDVTVISAVPLSPSQHENLEAQLSRTFKKRVAMTVETDPSLLGGLRIIAGHTIIDNTIKKKLSILKRRVYEGVYLN